MPHIRGILDPDENDIEETPLFSDSIAVMRAVRVSD